MLKYVRWLLRIRFSGTHYIQKQNDHHESKHFDGTRGQSSGCPHGWSHVRSRGRSFVCNQVGVREALRVVDLVRIRVVNRVGVR